MPDPPEARIIEERKTLPDDAIAVKRDDNVSELGVGLEERMRRERSQRKSRLL